MTMISKRIMALTVALLFTVILSAAFFPTIAPAQASAAAGTGTSPSEVTQPVTDTHAGDTPAWETATRPPAGEAQASDAVPSEKQLPEETAELNQAESDSLSETPSSPGSAPSSGTATVPEGGDRSISDSTPKLEDSVTVTTYGELKKALSEDNGFRTIYFAADITAESTGISVHPAKSEIIIDGGGYSFTQLTGTNTTGLINVDNAGAATTAVTLKNLSVNGKNYYGLVAIRDSLAGKVTLTLENVDYNGPQPVYFPGGRVRFAGGSYSLVNVAGITAGELAEARNVELGGHLRIDSAASAAAILWLTAATSTLTVLPEADVTITARSYFVFGSFAQATLEAGSRLSLTTSRFGFSYAGDSIGSFLIAEDAALILNHNTSEAYAALRISKTFEMRPGSSATIIRTGTDGIPLRFTQAGAQAIFNRPRRVFLYSSAGVPLRYTGSGSLSLEAAALNLWSKTDWPLTGDVMREPDGMWNKNNGEALTLSARYSTETIQSLTHNLNANDPVSSELTTGNFNLNKNQLLAFGETLLDPEPLLNNDAFIRGRSESGAGLKADYTLAGGMTGLATGNAAEDGHFSLTLPPEPLLSDSSVRLTSFAEGLYYRRDQAVADAGQHRLAFAEISPAIDFGSLTIPAAPEVVKRQDDVFRLTVSDNRLNPTPWRIDASVTTTGSGAANPLGGSLFFRHEGAEVSLSETPTTVYRHGTSAPGTIELTFGENEGPLLKAQPGAVHSDTAYQATLHWDLVDAP